MKAETTKSIEHELGFVVIATMVLVVLSLLVFPLFIGFLPIILISGIREIWFLDHLK